jgi:hypothetical protein
LAPIVQGALQWLEDNQDKSLEEVVSSEPTSKVDTEDQDNLAEGAPPLQEGEEAKSLVCDDCSKKFRSTAQAEWHASKT